MINRYKNNVTSNTVVAEQGFIDNLVDSQDWENLGEANPIPEPTLDELKEIKLKEVVDKYTLQYDTALGSYSSNEQATFISQETEFRQWTLDNTVPTPTVDRIASGRGIDRLTLLPKIGENLAYRDVNTGLQQAKEDEIKACATIEELEAL